MINIAIITSGFLPVPAVRGGGVEQLCTSIINKNEVYKKLNIDLYTVYDSQLENCCYNYTQIHQIKINKISRFIGKCLNRIMKSLNIGLFIDLYAYKCSKIINNQPNYDYIIIENNMFLFKIIKNNYKKKSKFIFHLHNDIDNYYKPRRLCKYIADNAYKVLTVSNYMKERFSKVTKRINNIEILYNCIPLEKFQYKNNDLRKKYNIKEDDIVFLYCGRFSKEKGLLELIEAFNNLFNEKAKLLIIGSPIKNRILKYDVINEYSKKIYKNSQNNKKIIHVGYVSNDKLNMYYSVSDIVVVPTLCEEAFGLVAVEAMACSKPLIVTNSGGLMEIVDSNCALILDKKNILNELEKSMKIFLENPILIKKMGENSLKKVSKKYSEEKYYFNFLDTLK